MRAIKQFNGIFTPQKTIMHQKGFTVATTIVKDSTHLKDATIIPAGTCVKAKSGNSIIEDPTVGVVVCTSAEVLAGTVHGVVASDIELDNILTSGDGTYSIGVMIEGILYEDAMLEAVIAGNGVPNTTKKIPDVAKKAMLANNIRFYNVRTVY